MARFIARVDSADREHVRLLREIVAREGWPAAASVGEEASEAVFLVVQHAASDRALQREYLRHLQSIYRAGDRSAGQSIALLTDRLRVAEKKPQLYGTQVEVRNREVIVHPIEDERNVDRRRAHLGMPPLAEYIRLLRETYGIQ